MNFLTKEDFKAKIFDYEKEKEWKYKGNNPCIIDFYADWCGPCRMLSPVLEELSKEYAGKIEIYKVNTENEPELSAVFGVSSIPTILFIPKNDKPQIAVGALPKESLKKAIEDVLKIK